MVLVAVFQIVCAHVGNGRVEIDYKLLSGFYIPASYMYRFARVNRSEKPNREMATRLKAIRGARGIPAA